MKTESEFNNRLFGRFNNLLAVQVAVLLLCIGAADSPGQTYTVLHRFSLGSGRSPQGGLIISGAALYGTAWVGGDFGRGTVFTLNTNGSNYTVLKHFTTIEGGLPEAGLILSGETLYGTTVLTGSTNLGTVFSVGTDGTEYSVIKEFTGSDGANPHARLLLSGTTLYGTTRGGGDFGYGTVFKIDVDGSGFVLLKSFENQEDGAEPFAGLVLSISTLYGTTVAGTIFKVKTDGSGFAVLKKLTWAEGAFPEGDLVLSGSTLYGTTLGGGVWGYGTVFKIGTNGNDFSILKSFAGRDGRGPRAGLILSGPTLFGTTSDTYEGNTTNLGTVFSINTNGTGFNVLKYFTGSEGSHPSCALVLAGTTLYGTTTFGDTSDYGVVFSVSLLPTISVPPQSQTAEENSTVSIAVDAGDNLLLSYQWFFDDTNAISDVTTNAWLELNNVQFSQSGTYTVVVSNAFGVVTSTPAMLNVIPSVERRPVPAINLTGEAGSALNVECIKSLSSPLTWLPLDTVSLSNPPEYWFDLTEPLPPQRYYRVWQMGTPGVTPSLGLHIVPAITLKGNIGDSLRVDYINAIGPTDAWVTLDTVMLTNTSQLYFDTSSIGQPRRLYRIVPEP